MSFPPEEPAEGVPHALNNLLSKILGAAELALDHPIDAPVRLEIETIIGLAEEGAGLVRRLNASHSAP